MYCRVITAVAVVVGIYSAASAQDVKLSEIDFGRYHALVIGNNDYEYLPKLNTAVGDAEAVATLLEDKYGFQVTKLTNATRRDITGAFNRLRQTLTERDNLLVYYAGHGVLDEEAGAGYWQPVDARSDDDCAKSARRGFGTPSAWLPRQLIAVTARPLLWTGEIPVPRDPSRSGREPCGPGGR